MKERPPLEGVLETSLYVDDVAASVAFYRELFDFDVMFQSERGAGLSVEGRQVFLLFRKGGTLEDIHDERGVIPAHDGGGNLHMAFAIPADALERWQERLRDLGIEIEATYHWERGGHSVYFRDPDGHLIELVTPGCWPIY
jgi:catechol 2,3-dioxygenase-like lactoylglutathione lyase family enzyme